MMRFLFDCRLLPVLMAMCLMAAFATAQVDHMNNPIQVRFESFSIEIGPTNNARPLSLKDATTILGMIEDLISNFARDHYHGASDSTTTKALRVRDGSSNDREARTAGRSGGLDFKYAILGLVDIPTHPEETRSMTTTLLEFSGGIAYFGGEYPEGEGPSAAEVQLLVSLALNSGDLVDALKVEFPYITEATYFRGSFYDIVEHRDPSREADNVYDASALMDSPIALESEDSQQQLIIVVMSACGAAAVFCLLVAFFYLLRQRQRRVFWRDNNHPNINTCKNPVTVPEVDAALDDPSCDQGYPKKSPSNRRSMMKEAKQQSLHLRDSLRDMSMQDQNVNDQQSDAGSSRLVGHLQSLATVAASCAKPISDDDLDKQNQKQPHTTDNSNLAAGANEDQDTSSCSHDDSSNESVQSKDYDTCPSDFEGNAIVKPNLLSVNLDRFNDDDPHNPLPPSQTASARQDDTLISMSMDDASESARTPAPTFSMSRSRSNQEGFLAKYIHPITGNILPLSSVGLSYFSSTTHDDDGDDEAEEDGGNDADCEEADYKRQSHLTPRTATTAGDHDSRWSDVSSDYKTDDDFELDRAWDPDDTSVNSSENGKEIFSPMSSSDEDEVRLLDSLGNHSYNLHKLRTPTKQPKQESPRKIQDVQDTETV